MDDPDTTSAHGAEQTAAGWKPMFPLLSVPSFKYGMYVMLPDIPEATVAGTLLPHQLQVMSTVNVPAPAAPTPFSNAYGALPVIELLCPFNVST